MLTTRYWTTSRSGGGVSPFGEPSTVLTGDRAAERVLRSVATWCSLNGLAFRIGVCSDPRNRAERLETSLVELSRNADGVLLHATYVRKPWNYMHVLYRTIDHRQALRLMERYVDLGRTLGRCENSPRDLLPPPLHPPYFVYVLTGRLPARNAPAPTRPEAPAPSLLGLADL